MTAEAPNLTPTEERIYTLLKDGKEHSKKELSKLLDDDLCGVQGLYKHMYNLRKKVAPIGAAIISVYGDAYRMLFLPPG